MSTLSLGGYIKNASALIWGTYARPCHRNLCLPLTDAISCSECITQGDQTVEQILMHYLNLEQNPPPAFMGLNFGHISDQIILPIGGFAAVDASNSTSPLSSSSLKSRNNHSPERSVLVPSSGDLGIQ